MTVMFIGPSGHLRPVETLVDAFAALHQINPELGTFMHSIWTDRVATQNIKNAELNKRILQLEEDRKIAHSYAYTLKAHTYEPRLNRRVIGNLTDNILATTKIVED